MDYKLITLLGGIATLCEEVVKTLFVEVSQFFAINVYMLAKMQELLANTFEDFKTIFDFLESPRRHLKLTTLSSTSTQIEARESNKKDGLFSERLR